MRDSKTHGANVSTAPFPRNVVPASAPRRFSFKPGSLCWWQEQPARVVERLQNTVQITLLRSGDDVTVAREELTALVVDDKSSLPLLSDLGRVNRKVWSRALEIQKAIVSLLAGERTRKTETSHAQAVGLSARQFRRLRVRYQKNPSILALLPSKPGRRAGSTVLDVTVESLMHDVICRELNDSPDIGVDDVLTIVRAECRAMRLRPPGRTTLAKRLRALRTADNVGGEIAEELKYRDRPVQQPFDVEHSLDLVLVDHTVCDVIIVDSHFRAPIHRPVLTVAIDARTRVIVGMLLTLEAPSSLSVALCLQHAVMPKGAWLAELGLEGCKWPGYGLPRAIYADNASEFHGRALTRGCDIHRVLVRWRRPGEPHMGGIVERVIGTFMGKVRLLPGATFSKLLRARPRDAERKACYTLDELRVYLARQISIYHCKRHAALRMSPKQAWERAWYSAGSTREPEIPADSTRFLLHFLPFEMRQVTREGIAMFGGLRYRSADLPALIRDEKRVVRYNPCDLSQVYVERDDGSHLIVPLQHPTIGRISLWEWKEIKKRLTVPIHPDDEEHMARAMEANRQLTKQAATKTRRMQEIHRWERERGWEQVAMRMPTPDIDEPLSPADQTSSGEAPLQCEIVE